MNTIASDDPHIQNLRKRGIDFEIVEKPILTSEGKPTYDKNGDPVVHRTILIKSIPTLEKEINSFFTEDKPCWFVGCEQLRKEYQAELVQMDLKDCQSCQKGNVMRKYEQKVRNILTPLVKSKASNERDTNTRVGKASSTNGASPEGTPAKRSMLRRAADRIAKVLGYYPG